jgi:hypothetical protein
MENGCGPYSALSLNVHAFRGRKMVGARGLCYQITGRQGRLFGSSGGGLDALATGHLRAHFGPIMSWMSPLAVRGGAAQQGIAAKHGGTASLQPHQLGVRRRASKTVFIDPRVHNIIRYCTSWEPAGTFAAMDEVGGGGNLESSYLRQFVDPKATDHHSLS